VPLFGGIPVTGAIARTATNIRSGARSPLSGIIHAITLLCIVLFAAPLARFIPLGTLAAVLFVVAYNMGEWREIPMILRRIARAQVVKPQWANGHLDGPLENGKIYGTAYITRAQFDQLQLPSDWQRFIVIRDLRDAFVSGYWSVKLSHPRRPS
jgi:hypothetical protein